MVAWMLHMVMPNRTDGYTWLELAIERQSGTVCASSLILGFSNFFVFFFVSDIVSHHGAPIAPQGLYGMT